MRSVCAEQGEQTDYIRAQSSIPESLPLFTLQGNLDAKKLRGIYRIMINIVVKAAAKKLSEKTERTAEEEDMLALMLCGGKRVSPENLREVSEWYGSLRA